jgi:hypothetical protein
MIVNPSQTDPMAELTHVELEWLKGRIENMRIEVSR